MIEIIRKDRLLWMSAAVGLLVIGFIAVLYISPVQKTVGAKTVNGFYDLSVVFFAGFAAVLMALLQSTFERREILWVVWGSLALGMFLWTVGEAITAYYELLKDEAPYPSTADVAWVVGYIPLFVGFFLRFRSLRTMPTLREFLIGAIIFALLLVLGVVFVIGPIVTATDYSSRTEQFLDVLYPVGDLALAFAALLSVIVLAGGTLSYPWITLAAGFLITSVADLIYSYATWNDLYVSGNSGTNPATFLVDVPYFAAYVVIAFAMLMQARLREVI